MTMTRLILILLLSVFAQASDPNDLIQLQTLTCNWLKPCVPVKSVFLFEGTTPFTWTYPQADGLLFRIECKSVQAAITVTGWTYRPVGLYEFAALSRAWQDETTHPVEPNIPAEPNLSEILSSVTDPNLIQAIKDMIK